MDLIRGVEWDNIVGVEGVDFVDGDGDLSKFKEGDFIEVLFENGFDNVLEEKKFIK